MAMENKKDATTVRSKKKSLPKRKRYNTRLIKTTWPYTVQEIAMLFNIHKNAVLRWIKEGLHANKIRNEYLIRGDALKHFLSERQQKKKHKCAANQFFCFKCHAPRRSYLDIADIIIISPSRFRLKGLCEQCGIAIHKVQGIRNLQKIQNCFHIQKMEEQHIIERTDPIVNSDLEAQL